MTHEAALDDALREAIRLAKQGRGHVEPNPTVGCVLLDEAGTILGRGFHERYGGPHAEPNALADAAARNRDVRRATAVVTLEPCCHTNKQTPPCVPTLIQAGVRRVVVGALDPNPAVNGEGLRQLRASGIETVFADAPACRQLLAPFVARTVHRRPYVTAKVAVSADGKVAGKAGVPVRLTGAASNRAVHGLRSRCDALAVGTNTVVNDDPSLTVRGIGHPPRVPRRVVLSNGLNLPRGAKLFNDGGPAPLVYTSADLELPGAEVVRLPGVATARGTMRFRFEDVLADLHGRGVTHLLIEPGPTLLAALTERGQIDRLWSFHCPASIGDDGLAVTLPDWPGHERRLGPDVLRESFLPASEVFFAVEPSADLDLATASERP